jgi:hypothetical protein
MGAFMSKGDGMARKNIRFQALDEKLENFEIRNEHWNNGKWYPIRVYPSRAERLSHLGYEVRPLENIKGVLYRKAYTRRGGQLSMFEEHTIKS